jgi:uncharacterized protein DUF861
VYQEQMAKMQKKSLDSSPDETRTFEKGKIELANLGDVTIGRGILEPGWSWEKCVKPIVKTDSCQAPHTQYFVSGKLKVVMDDGTEEEFGPGDAAVIPPGRIIKVQDSIIQDDITLKENYGMAYYVIRPSAFAMRTHINIFYYTHLWLQQHFWSFIDSRV